MDVSQLSHDIYFHIRIVIGVVLGLCLTRILSGLSHFVQHPKHRKLSVVHLLWVAIVLVSAIHFWWWEFSLIRHYPWRFEAFIFVLCYAFLFYLLASLLFPDDLSYYPGYEDYFQGYEEYFMARRGWFFGLLALTFVFDYVDTLLKGPERLAFLGAEYKIRIVVALLLAGVAAWTRNAHFHLAFAAIYLVYYVLWILRVYDYIS